MQRYEIGDLKGPESLRKVSAAEPTPGAGQVLVRIRANALNYRDVMVVRGGFGPKPPTLVPVSDGAGEVAAIGAGVTTVKVGDRVVIAFNVKWIDGPWGPQCFGGDLGGAIDGTLTEFGVFPEAALVQIPSDWTFAEAACLPCAGVTAWNAIMVAGQAKLGDTVLLQGTGGVSVFGVQIAKMIGATAVITSSHDDKLARAKALGADVGVNYKTNPDWPKAVLDATGGKGADVVLETVGPGNLDRSFAAAAFNGRIELIGGFEQASKPPGTIPMIAKNLTLRGIAVGSRRMLADLLALMSQKKQKPVIDARIPFADAPKAYELMIAQTHLGKIVITQ